MNDASMMCRVVCGGGASRCCLEHCRYVFHNVKPLSRRPSCGFMRSIRSTSTEPNSRLFLGGLSKYCRLLVNDFSDWGKLPRDIHNCRPSQVVLKVVYSKFLVILRRLLMMFWRFPQHHQEPLSLGFQPTEITHLKMSPMLPELSLFVIKLQSKAL